MPYKCRPAYNVLEISHAIDATPLAGAGMLYKPFYLAVILYAHVYMYGPHV